MSDSYSLSYTNTFTVTHAKHIAAKVATDLKRMQRFYGNPSDSQISEYEEEIIELLKAKCLGTVSYGFKRNGQWVEPTLRYTASDLDDMYGSDDDPGRVKPGANTTDASFYSYLTYNNNWYSLSDEDKNAVKNRLPFKRTSADEPGVDGYLTQDKMYSSGGRSLQRESVRSY